MKKLFYIFFLSVFCSSCSDVLDVTPDGRLDLDQVFADPYLTASYFSNCYNNLPGKGRCYYFWTNYPIALSDEAWDCDAGVKVYQAYKGQISAADNPLDDNRDPSVSSDSNYWERYFESIRSINVFLSRIPTAALNNEADRTRWTAEAYTLRAYFLLQLIKWYGGAPILTQELPLDYDYSNLKRNTFVECAKQIVADCDEALKCDNLPWRITNKAEIHRFTKGIAAAIRSEASLFAASPLNNLDDDPALWEWAYDVNKSSLQMLRDNGYELYTQCHDKDLFVLKGNPKEQEKAAVYDEYFVRHMDFTTTPIDKETIWEGNRDQRHQWFIQGFFPLTTYKAGLVPSQQLVDAYDMLATGKPVLNLEKPYLDEQCLEPNYNPGSGYNEKNPYAGRDPRFYATVYFNGSLKKVVGGKGPYKINTYIGGESELRPHDNIPAGDAFTRTGYYFRKGMHPDSDVANDLVDGKWKHYRLGAVILNMAEAAAETGHVDEAMALVNEIRHRAGFDPSVDVTASSKEEARLLVRHERQVELVYEEHRYFDCRRWGKESEDILNEKYLTGMKIEKAGITFKYTRFIVDSDGDVPSKMTYQKKYRRYPIVLSEVSRLESLTGQKWQNPGW